MYNVSLENMSSPIEGEGEFTNFQPGAQIEGEGEQKRRKRRKRKSKNQKRADKKAKAEKTKRQCEICAKHFCPCDGPRCMNGEANLPNCACREICNECMFNYSRNSGTRECTNPDCPISYNS